MSNDISPPSPRTRSSPTAPGLTKREYVATSIAASLLARNTLSDQDLATRAVDIADKILKECER